MFSPLIDRLIQALKRLPGVGPKSAQRMAFHLLENDRESANIIAEALAAAAASVNRCELCRNLTEQNICSICDDHRRDKSVLCIVENPADVVALEQAGSYSGLYFVLLGRLSPIDGIGPKEIGVDLLGHRFQHGELLEVIIATNPTAEGEATSHYVSQLAKRYEIKVSRIAHGVPLGGELEYLDGTTLAHALGTRREL
ncbi:MAG: recombination protein RecR [Alteromonadaceae bacterium]|nr:MAG: recombination protein RecR [Alteromonadaceae bacterium]